MLRTAWLMAWLIVLVTSGVAFAQSEPPAPVAGASPSADEVPTPPPDAAPPADATPPAPAEPAAAPSEAPQAMPSPSADDSDDSGEPPLEPPVSAASRPGIGFVGALGLHTGLAVGARFGLGDVGLELLGGYQLLLAEWRYSSRTRLHFDAGSSGQLAGEIYLTPIHPTDSSALGLRAGYRYNTVLHHGFAVAFAFIGELSPKLAIEGVAGASIFPGRSGTLRHELDIPSGTQLLYSSTLQLFEVGVELIVFP